MSFELLDDRIAVEVKKQTKTSGGLILPDGVPMDFCRGEVVVRGPGKWSIVTNDRLPMDIEVGDEVIFSEFAGVKDVKVDDKKIIVLREIDILVKIRKGTK